MKIVGLIPFWFNNGKSRDIKKLAGKYLIEYSVELLNSSHFIDETIIYSSSEEILNYIDSQLPVTYLKRDRRLDREDISIEDIIESFFNDCSADMVVLLHPYTPFLKKDTLNNCIVSVKERAFDSAFTAIENKKFAWYKREALNFKREDKSPKLKDLNSVILEQGLLYVIKKESFLKDKSRVGANPHIETINHFEAHEINEPQDFEMAELIVNSGMFQGV